MKYIFLLSFLFSLSSNIILAEKDKNISPDDLPSLARFFIRTEFPDNEIVTVLEENKKYIVMLSDGSKCEFDENGEWMNLECLNSQVPLLVVPQKILTTIRNNYGPNVTIQQIRRISRGRYDVELSNKARFRFDKKYEIIDIHEKELIALQNLISTRNK